jgi:hypothetical protein
MPLDLQGRMEENRSRGVAGFNEIVADWASQVRQEHPQHTTQLAAAEGLLVAIGKKLGEALPAAKHRSLLLSAYRILDYYQDRFGQRRWKHLQDYLRIADQLAYDCYRPVLKRKKLPAPLIVMNGAAGPYIQKRETPFVVESVVGNAGIDAEAAMARLLPFAVIGMPWDAHGRWEALPVIAHEVGHAVEDDLQLTAALQGVFADALWKEWQRELFADAWGCVCCGPAFLYGLAEYLWAGDRDDGKVRRGTKYPPAWLRLRCAAAVLGHLKLPGDSITAWLDEFPAPPDSGAYLAEAEAAMKRLLTEDLVPTVRIEQYSMSLTELKTAEKLARRWAGLESGVPEPASMVVSAAAARLAYNLAPERDNGPVAAALKAAVRPETRDAESSWHLLLAMDGAPGEDRNAGLIRMLLGE